MIFKVREDSYFRKTVYFWSNEGQGTTNLRPQIVCSKIKERKRLTWIRCSKTWLRKYLSREREIMKTFKCTHNVRKWEQITVRETKKGDWR